MSPDTRFNVEINSTARPRKHAVGNSKKEYGYMYIGEEKPPLGGKRLNRIAKEVPDSATQ